MEILLDNEAIFEIKTTAQSLYTTKAMPIYLGKDVTKVEQGDLAKLCLIEATITYLNKLNAFNSLPRFDYQHDRFKLSNQDVE